MRDRAATVSALGGRAIMLLRQPSLFFMLKRAGMLSRQWSAKFAWFSRHIFGRKFCDPLVNFFAGKNSRVEKTYQRASPPVPLQKRKRGFNCNQQIKRKRSVLDVVKVVLHFFR